MSKPYIYETITRGHVWIDPNDPVIHINNTDDQKFFSEMDNKGDTSSEHLIRVINHAFIQFLERALSACISKRQMRPINLGRFLTAAEVRMLQQAKLFFEHTLSKVEYPKGKMEADENTDVGKYWEAWSICCHLLGEEEDLNEGRWERFSITELYEELSMIIKKC